MKALRIFGLISAIYALAGCSPYALVSNETYNNANLSSYHTFHIVTPDEGKLPPGMQEVTYYNIAAAIREQLVERGFKEDPSSPLLVNIALTVKEKLLLNPQYLLEVFLTQGHIGGTVYNGYSPFYMYPPSYWSNYYTNARIITGIYKEGVLTMDIVNIQKQIPLYSASVATILQNNESRFRDLEGIAEAVNVLFSKFPVPILPQYK